MLNKNQKIENQRSYKRRKKDQKEELKKEESTTNRIEKLKKIIPSRVEA